MKNEIAFFNCLGLACIGVGVFIVFGLGVTMIYAGAVALFLAMCITAMEAKKKKEDDPVQRGFDLQNKVEINKTK